MNDIKSQGMVTSKSNLTGKFMLKNIENFQSLIATNFSWFNIIFIPNAVQHSRQKLLKRENKGAWNKNKLKNFKAAWKFETSWKLEENF